MTTFSQLVDEISVQVSRPDLQSLIAGQLNLTIRELFFTDRNTPVFYHRQRFEEQLTVDSEMNFVWDLDRPLLFQMIETMRFDSVYDINGKPMYAKEVTPGRVMNQEYYFYYRTGDSFAIKGAGGIGSLISVSFFEYLPSLKYFEVADRPATYDIADGWSYHDDYDDTPELMAQAEALTSNWMLLKWKEFIAEGTRAKMYKLASDDPRSRVSFSLYQNLRSDFYMAEAVNSLQQ